MSRGNHRGDIFREDEDYLLFLHLLRDTQKIYPFVIHSYCLMTNHFHLQLETKEKEIWHIMRRFSKLYTANFNDKYRLVGHLFQGRYMSVLIEDDAYFLQTSRYIHRNPVKANMVAHPGDYPWSSYSVYLGHKESDLVTTQKVLGYFRDSSPDLYRQYVEDASHTDYRERKIQESLGENDLWLPW